MNISNYTEVIVADKIAGILSGMEGVCTCESCTSDIAAIALNNLTPHYFSTEKGLLFNKLSSLESQVMTDVITQVTEAAGTVMKKPRH